MSGRRSSGCACAPAHPQVAAVDAVEGVVRRGRRLRAVMRAAAGEPAIIASAGGAGHGAERQHRAAARRYAASSTSGSRAQASVFDRPPLMPASASSVGDGCSRAISASVASWNTMSGRQVVLARHLGAPGFQRLEAAQRPSSSGSGGGFGTPLWRRRAAAGRCACWWAPARLAASASAARRRAAPRAPRRSAPAC